MAGRSTSRIRLVQQELRIASDRVRVIEVDVLKEESVAAAIKTIRVVIDVVGPYWRWGKAVVQCVVGGLFYRSLANKHARIHSACAAEGVHYVDLTGEPPYMKWVVDEYVPC